MIGGFGTGAAQPALMTLTVDQSTPSAAANRWPSFNCFYDLGIGIGSLYPRRVARSTDQAKVITHTHRIFSDSVYQQGDGADRTVDQLAQEKCKCQHEQDRISSPLPNGRGGG